jgi:hypothetical protein
MQCYASFNLIFSLILIFFYFNIFGRLVSIFLCYLLQIKSKQTKIFKSKSAGLKLNLIKNKVNFERLRFFIVFFFLCYVINFEHDHVTNIHQDLKRKIRIYYHKEKLTKTAFKLCMI